MCTPLLRLILYHMLLGLSLICSKIYLLFLPELFKILTYSYFIPIAPSIILLYSNVPMIIIITMQSCGHLDLDKGLLNYSLYQQYCYLLKIIVTYIVTDCFNRIFDVLLEYLDLLQPRRQAVTYYS